MATFASSVSMKWLAVAALSLTLTACHGAGPACAQHTGHHYDLEMYNNPFFAPLEQYVVYPVGLKRLWLTALERPDAELQRMVIDSIALAHRRGVEGMNETVPRLVTLLAEPDQTLEVRRATVNALITMDAQDQAANIAAIASKYGLSIAQIVEPALAKWQSPAMKTVWLQRVKDANASATMMMLAINGLAALKSPEANDSLEQILRSTGRPLPMRIAAARALGINRAQGVVDLAQEMQRDASAGSPFGSLVAIELLSRSDDERSVGLLKEIANGDNSAVQSRALQRLFEIDPAIVNGLADGLVGSDDVNVRRWCAQAMIAMHTAERIKPLSRLLDDVNPSLRYEVANALCDLGQDPQLRDAVTENTMDVLKQDQWRGCEQAAVVLARMDHKGCGTRMVELLGHQRGEVQVATAWGLKQLKIAELLPDMLDHAQSVYDGFRSGQLNRDVLGPSLQMAHLFIAFGDQRYHQADPLMRKYLPKDFSLGDHSRPAAAWRWECCTKTSRKRTWRRSWSSGFRMCGVRSANRERCGPCAWSAWAA